MALEQLKLDDLTWTQMVTAIRRRIPAASDGLWTLHAPVDPGVTLLELYAYLLEQRLYWLDQTPDALVHAALSLMGERARAARPAATVMRLPPGNFKTLPKPFELRLARRNPAIVFTADEEIVLLPVRETGEPRREQYAVGLYIGGRDRALDLRHGRRVCLLPADGSAAEFHIVLPLTAAPTGDASGKFFSLLIELETPSSVPAEWSPEAVADVPPPAQLTWSYRRAGTGERAPFEKVEDGTAGLRRSGVVRLSLPSDWTAEPDLPAGEAYAVWVRTERASYSSPPVVRQVVPNAIIARHRRRTDTHEFTREWLPLPGSQISLPDLYTEPGGDSTPLQDHPALEDSFALSIRERDGLWHEWQTTHALTFHGPDERVFIVERETGTLRFGDGLTGRVPVPGKGNPPGNIRLSYQVGGGAAGNHGRGLTFEGLTNSAFKARNVVAAEGGEESETLDHARERAAAALRRVERAITASDHEQLLVSAPGVISGLGVAFSRAHAELGRHPCHPCRRVPGAVSVYVVPDVPRTEERDDCAYVAAPVPDPGALAAARARVERARLVASEVFVLPAVYREVSLAIQLIGDPVDANALRETITRRMRDFLDPLIGGADGTGWGFGEPLRPSALLREAQRATGENASVSWVGIGLDGAPPEEKCLDIFIESHELVVAGEVQISLRRAAAGQGGLR